MVVTDAEQLAQGLAILEDILFAVTTIVIDIKRCIVAFAAASMACTAEGPNACPNVIIIQLWLFHFADMFQVLATKIQVFYIFLLKKEGNGKLFHKFAANLG